MEIYLGVVVDSFGWAGLLTNKYTQGVTVAESMDRDK